MHFLSPLVLNFITRFLLISRRCQAFFAFTYAIKVDLRKNKSKIFLVRLA